MESSKLASYLASRIFHDLVSPLTGVMQGCSLVFDDDMGLAMRAEGEKLLKEGIAGIEAKIQFMRFAVGAQALSDAQCDPHMAKMLFDKLFSIQKSKLDWRVDTWSVSNRQMRVLMNMTLVMLDPAAKSGVVRVNAREEGDSLVLEVEAVGQPGELKKEVQASLAGIEPERGWGSAIQPLFLTMIADEIGFRIDTMPVEGGVRMTARGPKMTL
jgi:hypothetical protein